MRMATSQSSKISSLAILTRTPSTPGSCIRRLASLRPTPLIGGDQLVIRPGRQAILRLLEAGCDARQIATLFPDKKPEINLLEKLFSKRSP